MARQVIGIGSAPDDGTGDTLRDGGDKINDNFAELYAPQVPRVSGRYYPILGNVRTVTNAASQAGVMRFTPFFLDQAVTISQLWTYINNNSAGQSIQIAIYNNHATNIRPSTLVASTGNISAASVGNVSGAVTQGGGSVTLQPGLYWFGTNASDGVISTVGLNVDTMFPFFFMGSATISAGVPFTATGQIGYRVDYAQAFGTWPDLTAVTPTNYAPTSGTPLMPFGGYKVA